MRPPNKMANRIIRVDPEVSGVIEKRLESLEAARVKGGRRGRVTTRNDAVRSLMAEAGIRLPS